MKRKLALTAVVTMILVLLFPAVALAIDDPDALATNDVYVYEHLLETGDCGVLMVNNIQYDPTANPAETITEAYLGIFIDTDGSTQLKATAPYYFTDTGDDGWGMGIIWIYFTAAEVTTYSIDSADELLYSNWLTGNPTLVLNPGPNPPNIAAPISYWQPAGTSTSTLFTLRILSLATTLGTAWGTPLIQDTALGHRLTSDGEDYFTNSIPNLRDIAPSLFASGTYDPVQEPIDYSTAFGATMTNGTGTMVAASPLTLTSGANTIAIATTGNFTLDLVKGTEGTAVSSGATLDSSPIDLVYGESTINVSALAGDNSIVVTVALVDTQTTITGSVTGTGLDVEPVATLFGMSTMMMSGLIWLGVSVMVSAGVYKTRGSRTSGKSVFYIFYVCLTGGVILGLLPVLASTLLFIGAMLVVAYVVFFRSSGV